ncbi:MAG TPA: Do family serine endopeptidase, partial [bacterium]|nr:Do family serine endopeptidase [bacterium]
MKKKYALLFIVIGIIIGLGISIKMNWTNGINANNYYVEEKNEKPDYKQLSNAFIEAAKRVSPATVYIYTEQVQHQTRSLRRHPFFGENDPFREFFGDDFLERFFGGIPEEEQRRQSLGSGIIVSQNGYVITNNHVVENADKIKVKLLDDAKEYDAKLIGADKKSDIAILKIEGSNKNFPFAKLGDSDKLEVGEWVIAIGNPFGFSHTVTAGIVSALGRNLGISMYEDFIQTDCSINPGNSGGPMINLNGSVIGINTAIYSRTGGNQGIGFAIPINMVKKIMVDLIEKGVVRRGYLGVSISDVSEAIAEKFGLDKNTRGALVSQVFRNSPADRGGIKEGDIIVEFDGVKITDSNRLKNTVANTPIGKAVKIKVYRDGSEKILEIKITEQPGNMEDLASDDIGDGDAESSY